MQYSEFLFTPSTIYEKIKQWNKLLPNITPFFAIKSNPNKIVLEHISASLKETYNNVTFDCASKWEMDIALLNGAIAENIIFSHPTKCISDLIFARENGIKKLVFDCESELEKIARYYPDADLILRILTDDQYSKCKFSNKFGAPLFSTDPLLLNAKMLHLNVIGVSFHVGSNCSSPYSFERAIKDSMEVIKIAKLYNFKIQLIDIGGGFSFNNFDRVATKINEIIVKQNDFNLKFIAEPGRFFVENCQSLIVSIIGSKNISGDDGKMKKQYTINDSVYNSLNNIIMDHYELKWKENLFSLGNNETEEDLYETTIFGNTCDGADIMCKDILAPEFHIGDQLLLKNMGAYTTMFIPQDEKIQCFNGFQKAHFTLLL